MKFPTANDFNKQTENKILKWREVETNVIYKIEECKQIKTAKGFTTIVVLKGQDGKLIKSFITSCLERDLKDLNEDYYWYIRSNGPKTSKNDHTYYSYQILKYPVKTIDEVKVDYDY